MNSTQTPSRWMVILAFGLVYLFWGSTYLGIDIAEQTIPPALMCAVRFSIAGVVMLAVCAATGRKILYSPKQIALASIVGLLLLMGRQSYALLCRACRIFRTRSLDRRHHAAMVSGAGFPFARRPPHFRPRQSRTRFSASLDCSSGLARTSFRYDRPSRTLGVHQPYRRIIQLGAGFGAFETLAIGHGHLQRHRLASHRRRSRKSYLRPLRR